MGNYSENAFIKTFFQFFVNADRKIKMFFERMSSGLKSHPEVLANRLSLHHFMEVLIEFLAKNVLRQGLVRVKRLLLQTHRNEPEHY